MPWSPADLADAIFAGFQKRAQADDLEQAVYGFDALDELGIHPIIQQALRDAGYGVWPEERYPSDRKSQSKKSLGRRCDIVLTPQDKPLRDPQAIATLYDSPNALDYQDAYWLEVKLVAQFEIEGPFRRYAAELLAPVAKDIQKLWNDEEIFHAGLLLVLLTSDQATSQHDLFAWHNRCLEKGYPIATPAVRGMNITNRIGNGYCAIALFGVRGL